MKAKITVIEHSDQMYTVTKDHGKAHWRLELTEKEAIEVFALLLSVLGSKAGRILGRLFCGWKS